MKTMILAVMASATLGISAATLDYQPVADWLKLPEGRPALGNHHGDVAVSSNGEVYVSVEDPQAGLQVYGNSSRSSGSRASWCRHTAWR